MYSEILSGNSDVSYDHINKKAAYLDEMKKYAVCLDEKRGLCGTEGVMVLADTYGNRTKYELKGALKEMLRQKPLDQIRVWERTELCGIRRQSFYYHFTDIYELFSWSVRQERTALPTGRGMISITPTARPRTGYVSVPRRTTMDVPFHLMLH